MSDGNLINVAILVLIVVLAWRWMNDRRSREFFNEPRNTQPRRDAKRDVRRDARRDARRDVRRDARRDTRRDVRRDARRDTPSESPSTNSLLDEHKCFQQDMLNKNPITNSADLLPPALENNTWGNDTFVLQPNAEDATSRILPEVVESIRGQDKQLGRELLVIPKDPSISIWNKSSIGEQTQNFLLAEC